MAQPRPAKTYPLKVEQFAEKLPKPNSEIYASNHGLLRGELLNFGSVFVFLVNIRRTDFFPANFLKFISSIQQFLVAWNCLGWVGWFMDSPRHPWKSAVVFFFDFFLVQKKTGARTRVAWQWEWCLKFFFLQSCTNEKMKEMLFNNRIEGKMDRSWMRYMEIWYMEWLYLYYYMYIYIHVLLFGYM